MGLEQVLRMQNMKPAHWDLGRFKAAAFRGTKKRIYLNVHSDVSINIQPK